MIKKTLLLIAMLLPMCVKAQLGVGSWELFGAYMTPDKLIETPTKVYCLSSGALMSYDKETTEIYNYGLDNYLSETGITGIYYNPAGKYLVCTYETGNIDVIYDSGKVVNLTDIKDAVLSSSRAINDVEFSDGRMYVGTNFGLVVYDDKKMVVKESGNYEIAVTGIGVTDNYLGLLLGDKRLAFLPMGHRVNMLENFDVIANDVNTSGHFVGASDKTFVYGSMVWSSALNKSVPGMRKLTYDPAAHTISLSWYGSPAGTNVRDFFKWTNGIYTYDDENIYKILANGNIERITIPTALAGKELCFWADSNDLWVGDATGIGNYELDGAGSFTTITSPFRGNVLSTSKVGRLYFSPSGKLYVGPYGKSDLYTSDWVGGGNPSNVTSTMDVIDTNGKISNITPSGMRDFFGGITTRHAGQVFEDPDDPDVWYWSLWFDGVSKNRTNLATGESTSLVTFNHDNSSLLEQWYYRVQDIAFDRMGNLWVFHLGRNNMMAILPASVRRTKDVTDKTDWYESQPQVTDYMTDGHMIACQQSDMVFYSWLYSRRLVAIKTNDSANPADHVTYVWTKFNDQDDKLYTLDQGNYITDMKEDHDGQIWVTTTLGIFVIPNPEQAATNPNMKVRRVKVPRNDGTNYADYLLDGEHVVSVAIDNSNRKWFATFNSGVYLTNEDGSAILEHYDTTNSLLPSDRVYGVACDPNSTAVYFATTGGLVKYNSNAAPSADNLSEIYAYPNPVRPDYTGWITITGLMDNSLVIITDNAGNEVLKQVSNGGMITWDGCDKSGQRVKTGVYYVLASFTDENDRSQTASTKILVVK